MMRAFDLIGWTLSAPLLGYALWAAVANWVKLVTWPLRRGRRGSAPPATPFVVIITGTLGLAALPVRGSLSFVWAPILADVVWPLVVVSIVRASVRRASG